MSTVRLSVTKAQEQIKAIFMGVGVPEEDAQRTADSLLDAELSGVESHGLMRLKAYVDRLAAKTINPTPNIQMRINGAVILTDGDNGLGQVVTSRTADRCLQLAKEYGVAIASVGRSNHFGTAGYYAAHMAKEGCFGITASAAGPSVAPYGGMEPLLGTNPFSVAFPGQRQTFCLDIATSAVAKGKIRIYSQKGLPIPLGWALDEEGRDTTDPEAAINGILLPMAGPKGFGLAMTVDALCGLLSGSKLSCESTSMFHTQSTADIAHFVAVIDIAHFLPEEEFRQRAQAWFDRICGSRRRPGVERIFLPGELESLRKEAVGDSIEVLEQTAETLERYYQTYGR